MLIDTILKDKGNVVETISDSLTLLEAAKILDQKRIGAIVAVDDTGELCGVLSERDIVRGMSQHGADLHDVLVSELMTADLIRCAPGDTVNEAMAMMTDRRIRHLPVFEAEELVGFISIGDLVKCRMMEVQSEAEALRQYINS